MPAYGSTTADKEKPLK